jgi:hypothetical protein
MKDEALKLALEALKNGIDGQTSTEMDKAITAIKQALAAPVQEPVAIALNTGTRQGVKWLKNIEHGEGLYTTPPAQPAPVPLTDDAIHEMANDFVAGHVFLYRSFARAIEAAHGIKENT